MSDILDAMTAYFGGPVPKLPWSRDDLDYLLEVYRSAARDGADMLWVNVWDKVGKADPLVLMTVAEEIIDVQIETSRETHAAFGLNLPYFEGEAIAAIVSAFGERLAEIAANGGGQA